MIIQINATVCAAVDHGEEGQLNIAGRSWREDGARRPRKGQLPGETTNPMSAAGSRFLPPMQNGVVTRSSSLRE
jgi:hypothetical protein